MKNKILSDEELDAMLQSLDGIEKLEPSPFFYTRLKGRIQNLPATEFSFFKRLKPAFVFPVITAIIIVNIFTIFYKLAATNDQEQPTQTQSVVEQVANEYDLGVSSY